MRYKTGDSVRLKHTGDLGIIRKELEAGLFHVYLPADDMEIPAFAEDLELPEVRPAATAEPTGRRSEPAAPPVRNREVPVETQYLILRHSGIQLAFVPVGGRDGSTDSYDIHLLNDTAYAALYEIRLSRNNGRQAWDGTVAAGGSGRLGSMAYDDLNEAPVVEATLRWVTTEGVGPAVEKTVSIRPKTFFASLRTAPFLNRAAHQYRLFEAPVQGAGPSADVAPVTEDLASYTRRHTKASPVPVAHRHKDLSRHETRELAEFPSELDLHIEKLTDGWKKMSNAEILRFQLASFDRYLDKAVRLGVERVFVIHGLGQGRLKDSIATRLIKRPDVERFTNEYHPAYGWGATEVIFR
ncbi:MAG: hypothetical protein RLY31_593 [Bacteroidota bacterium]|jgi:hypothetical protein